MKKIILMPDSFKGTMSSSEICALMKEQILRHVPDCCVDSIPVADGGEGTVECFIEAMNGVRHTLTVKGRHTTLYYIPSTIQQPLYRKQTRHIYPLELNIKHIHRYYPSDTANDRPAQRPRL